MRWLRHGFAPLVRTRFQAACMERIQEAIAASEKVHHAEICFAVERAFSLADLVADLDSRALTLCSRNCACGTRKPTTAC